MENPDVILLDHGLPDIDGIEVTRRIREWSQVPTIILSARGDEMNKVDALDYLTKAFALPELFARIRAALRFGAPLGQGAAALAIIAWPIRV